MARRIMVTQADGSTPVLEETGAEDEAQLQSLIKEHPDLLPVEEFGLTGPLLVLGEETTLPSGAIDLLGATRQGAIVIVEFKTGPQNADFRRALAQLLDYGSDLWGMSVDEFESAVAVRYLSSDRCLEPRTKGANSLEEAARRQWDDLTEEELSGFREQLGQRLEDGAFHYVLAAQRFVPSVQKTIDYLNAVASGPRFYAVELIRFEGEEIAAFESRTVAQPANGTRRRSPGIIDEARFMDSVHEDEYKAVLQQQLDAFRGLGLRIEWGSVGCSVRVPTPYRTQPLTVAWIFPPGRSGWMGLEDLTMGFDRSQAELARGAIPVLERYAAEVQELGGVEPAKTQLVEGYHLSPRRVIELRTQIVDILAELVKEVGGGA